METTKEGLFCHKYYADCNDAECKSAVRVVAQGRHGHGARGDFVAWLARLQEAERGTRFAVAKGKRGKGAALKCFYVLLSKAHSVPGRAV